MAGTSLLHEKRSGNRRHGDRRRSLQEDADCQSGGSSTGNIFTEDSVNDDDVTSNIVRVATWKSMEDKLQPLVDSYNARQQQQQQSDISPAFIELVSFPSLETFDLEIQTQTTEISSSLLYDAFIIPNILMGTLAQHVQLQKLNSRFDAATPSDADANTNTDIDIDDLLPYYKRNLARYNGDYYSIPLLGGSQYFLLYRKDLLDATNTEAPTTWDEYNDVARLYHSSIFSGSCLGRYTDSSYLSIIMLASITQHAKMSTQSYWLDYQQNQKNGSSSAGPIPLSAALPQVLQWMEQQYQTGYTFDDLQELDLNPIDLNLQALQNGTCLMTITDRHPFQDSIDNSTDATPTADIQQMYGIAPLPGSDKVLVDGELQSCSDLDQVCSSRRRNQIQTSSATAPIGAVSSTSTDRRQDAAFDFLRFLSLQGVVPVNNDDDASTGSQSNDDEEVQVITQQPLYQSQLDALSSMHPEYAAVLQQINNDTTADDMSTIAYPPRIPQSNLYWDDILDKTINEYLRDPKEYSSARRQAVAGQIETQWRSMMQQQDALAANTNLKGHENRIPISVWHPKSVNTFETTRGERVTIDNIIRSVGWALGIITIFIALYMAIWVTRNRKDRVILASQPYFLYMLCAGIAIMGCSLIFFGFDYNFHIMSADIACMASIWWYCMGFIIAFVALFSKTWRINQIFRSQLSYQRIKVEVQDVLIPFLFILGMNVMILLLWTIMDPLQFEFELKDKDEWVNPNEILVLEEPDMVGRCTSTYAIVYTCILVGMNLVFAFVALIQAYECRRITTEFSESLWIAGTLLTIVQVWVVGIPVYGVVRGDVNLQYVVIVTIIFITCASILGFIFVPKIKQLNAKRKEQRMQQKDTVTVLEEEAEEEFGIEVRRSLPGSSLSMLLAAHNKQQQNLHRNSSTRRGLRLFTSQGKHISEVQQLKDDLQRTAKLNRTLQDRLEMLKEKFHTHRIHKAKTKISGKVIVTD
mmetsp:Transcript_23795/g.67282  ORF Transcript_23795/g.67282 Transcript_23795/m.67282 type:complete len:979 (+) Transcript_23795:289-3225(+)|eukprot:CAMPEP_0119569548 /NCGR_PEP_ID=MMETSP1352-20130426/41987_1 /TAXON_ID=265584 /ORGANISM="Stauroneis constricta, Strain CCMP1120" /LENGTH=978 /DNA_ID=CAMNT_0007619113 /DNA_START=225 /DNA_END=3161 /DNA_ORIENTATION=-